MGEWRNKIVFLEGYGILRLLLWEETQMPEITVIVPVYNVEQYLRRCLDSILGQSFQDFELICINDCSPDGSQAILNEYKNKYPQKGKQESAESSGQEANISHLLTVMIISGRIIWKPMRVK